jgi:arabinogalactan oligomer/maltooligosaccharide transport system substrate-binding protein
MKKKQILSVALAATMAAGLVGCGKKEESKSSDSGSTDSSSSSSSGNQEAIDNLIKNTSGTVALTVWASEEDQDFTQKRIDDFKAQYKDVTFDIKLGACSEADAKDTVLTDVEAAADIFAFADDQLNELVNAGALNEVVQTYTFDVKTANNPGSVEAASMNGKLYAYPMTADNGYFMYYDKSVFTEEDVQSLDKMIEVASSKGKKIGMMVSNGWYNYSFFKGAGLSADLADDGVNTICDWNAEGGKDVAQAIIDLGKTGTFIDLKEDSDVVTGVKDGKLAAAVSGTWNSGSIKEAWGDNYAATKLPTYTVAGKQVQMSSFAGYKFIGVNSHSKQIGWSMLLAEFLTNEESQIQRFTARSLGPSNIVAASSSEVQSDPAIAALAAQSAYATTQRVGGNYWDPAATLGLTLISGNPDGTDIQTLLDNAVKAITAPAN